MRFENVASAAAAARSPAAAQNTVVVSPMRMLRPLLRASMVLSAVV